MNRGKKNKDVLTQEEPVTRQMDLVEKLQHHHSVSKIRKEPKLGGAVRTM